jgi:protein TonB
MTPRFTRHAGAAIAVALHAAAGVALLNYEPARAALLAAAPMMVSFVSPPAPKVEERKPEPRIEPPKPRPVAKRPKPVEPPPVLAAPVEAPSPVVVAPPPPPPPAPEPEPIVVAPPPPLPVTQPVFDADYLENPAPSYPQLSRRTREEGRVILRVLVNPRGSAEDVQVRTSSGHARLDESARDTVRRWKFVPAKRGAEPVSAWVLIPISFRLDS